MQDDITDGVDWLVSQGIADKKRIGIYGASYGGYAVLAGLAFTPGVYACGIDYVGVSNLLTFMEGIPPLLGTIPADDVRNGRQPGTPERSTQSRLPRLPRR